MNHLIVPQALAIRKNLTEEIRDKDKEDEDVAFKPVDKDVALKQYERFAADLRFQHKLIWEIPSVAVAIMAGIILVSFSTLNELPRIGLLCIGIVLQFGLMLAVAKHRFTADAKTEFLNELEKILGTKSFPMKTVDTKPYLEERGFTGNRLFRFLIRPNSVEIMLLYVMVATLVIIILLVVYAALTSVTLNLYLYHPLLSYLH